jgi:hypothetical protein
MTGRRLSAQRWTIAGIVAVGALVTASARAAPQLVARLSTPSRVTSAAGLTFPGEQRYYSRPTPLPAGATFTPASAWSLWSADPSSFRTVELVSGNAPFDESAGVDANGNWALTYSRCASATWTTRSHCSLYEWGWRSVVQGQTEQRLNPGASLSEILPVLSDTLLAFVVDERPERVDLEDLSSGRTATVARPPRGVPAAMVTSLSLDGQWLAVAWTGRVRRDRVRSEIELLDLPRGRAQRIMSLTAGGAAPDELISPSISGGYLYFARAGSAGRFYRVALGTSRVRSMPAPRHLASFAISQSISGPPGSQDVVYSTGILGGGTSVRCHRPTQPATYQGCSVWEEVTRFGPF